jgi:hypothetical protein
MISVGNGRWVAVVAFAAAATFAQAERNAGRFPAMSQPPPRRIRAETLPNPGIPGFNFPETEATVTRWITLGGADQIALHGWGLWTALTSETDQRYEGQPLRVFETWLTPQDLLAHPDATNSTNLAQMPRRRSPLAQLEQLRRPAVAAGSNDRVAGYVKYDPTAADHILTQGLLSRSTLQTLLDGGAQQITPFPTAALVVKPIFQIASPAALVDGRYFLLKVWEGPPPVAQPYPPALWPHAIWVDLLGGGGGNGDIDQAPRADGSSRTDATTYPLGAFIAFALSAADAAGLNADKPGSNAEAGDWALLVGMHVAGRETARWTWQTFWWTPAPDAPPAPSSLAIAAARPSQLAGAARHYAMATAYAMELPNQPVIGGENRGEPVYAYNPWVEAAFGPSDLPDSQQGSDASGLPVANNVGVQTNCMSCHARATFNPRLLASAPRFSGTRYTDLSDPQFAGTLQVDFLYSLPRTAR